MMNCTGKRISPSGDVWCDYTRGAGGAGGGYCVSISFHKGKKKCCVCIKYLRQRTRHDFILNRKLNLEWIDLVRVVAMLMFLKMVEHVLVWFALDTKVIAALLLVRYCFRTTKESNME